MIAVRLKLKHLVMEILSLCFVSSLHVGVSQAIPPEVCMRVGACPRMRVLSQSECRRSTIGCTSAFRAHIYKTNESDLEASFKRFRRRLSVRLVCFQECLKNNGR